MIVPQTFFLLDYNGDHDVQSC